MRVCVIPDVHLKPSMFYQADVIMQKQTVDQAVCLMDLPDDWNKEFQIDLYIQTIDAAIAFQKKYPETIWIYGNHDLSYLWEMPESGYSSAASYTVRRKLFELIEVLPKARQINYVYKIDSVIFCHGGLTETFVNSYVKKELIDDPDCVVDVINSLGRDEMWQNASPIWHRPQYHKEHLYKADRLLQVVGHTPVQEIKRTGNLISCDVFSTEPSGKPIGSQKFLLLDTLTWLYEEHR